MDWPRFKIEYIHIYPVRKGLVAQPEEWRWSSAGWSESKKLAQARAD